MVTDPQVLGTCTMPPKPEPHSRVYQEHAGPLQSGLLLPDHHQSFCKLKSLQALRNLTLTLNVPIVQGHLRWA